MGACSLQAPHCEPQAHLAVGRHCLVEHVQQRVPISEARVLRHEVRHVHLEGGEVQESAVREPWPWEGLFMPLRAQAVTNAPA